MADETKSNAYVLSDSSTKLVTEAVLYYILTHLDTIMAENGTFEHLVANTAVITDLYTKNLTVDGKLKAKDIETETIAADVGTFKKVYSDYVEANTGKFEKLEATYEKVGTIDADLANIVSVLAGHVGTGSLQTIVINSDNATIGNDVIESAMIKELTFDKITGFKVNTTRVDVSSEDGLSTWKDNTIIIRDSGNNIRVQIGKDSKGDYNMYVYDKDGKVMFDPLGLTKDGVNRQIIDNDAIVDNAMISGSKLDIDSLIKSINTSTGEEKLSSGSIYYDNKNQTLHEVMNEMTTGISDNMKEIASTKDSLEAFKTKAVKGVKNMFANGDSNTVAPTDNWSDIPPQWINGKYMWQKVVTTYGDGTSSVSNPICISGAEGAAGSSVTLTKYKTQYQVGTSGTTAPTGTWSDNVVATTTGQYLWTRIQVTFSNGNTYTSYSVSAHGQKGDTGLRGAEGPQGIPGTSVTIKSTSVLYQVGGSATTPPSGTWIANIPATGPGQFLWTRMITSFSDGKSVTAYSVAAHGATGAQGLRGIQGEKGDQGIPGNDGYSPTVSITKNGNSSVVTITDKTGAHSTTVLDGEKGTPGAKGADGKTSYFHVKYSNDGGKTFTANAGEAVGDYIGTRTDFTEADSTNVADYTWAKIKGEQGAQGLRGIQGPKGDQGIAGQNGTNGTNGKTSYFHIKYSSVANPTSASQLTENPSTYIGTYVDFTEADSTDPAKYTWTQFKGSQGAKGDQGIAGKNGTDGKTSYLHIAYANSADGSNGFDISNGEGKLYIGQYTDFTQADSTDRTKYTWTKIKGEQGIQGVQGIQGPKGVDGKTSYFHIKYSTVDKPTNANQLTETPSTYIGTYVDYTETDSTDPTKYTWSRFEGIKGDQGIPGVNGTNGKTSYLHIAYANDITGASNFSTTDPTGRAYLGQYTDFAQADSTDYTKYSWSKIKGDKGEQGPKGADGKTTYFHIKYSSVANPTSASQMTENPSTYIGTYVDYVEADSNDPARYSWSRFVGMQGDQGVAGKNGTDGKTYYLHIAYANGADGINGFSTTDPTGRKYLGQCTDLNQADPTTPASYQWSLIKGDKGLGVKAVVPQYYLSTSSASQSGGSWTETQPAWTSGKYIWTRSKVTWDDNSVTYSDPILANGINSANDKANQAYNLANTANGNASNALNKANSAVNQANMGMNKWLVTKYNSGKSDNSITTIPLLLVNRLTPESTMEYDNIFSNSFIGIPGPRSGIIFSDETRVAYAITYVKFSADTTVSNFALATDDGGTLYLNGSQTIRNGSYGSSAGVSVIFKKGWNAIEVVVHHGASVGGFALATYDSTNKTYSALDLTKLANFERMDCYCSAFSGQTAYGLAANAKILETSSSLETVSRTVTDNKNGVKDLMTRTSQVETNVTNLKNLENTHYSTMTTQYNNQQKTIDGTVTRLGKAEDRITTVSNDLSNLNIGGRNLYLNTSPYRENSPFVMSGTGTDIIAEHFNGKPIYSVTKLAKGTEVVVQAKSNIPWALVHGGSANNKNRVGMWFYECSSLDNAKIPRYTSPRFLSGDNKSTYMVWKIKANSDCYPAFRFNVYSDGTDTVTGKVWDIKLELGNKATDWSPAPEDFDNKITEQSTALATYKQTTDQNLAQISSTYQRKDGMSNYATNSSVTSAINQAKDQINSSVSSNYVKTKDFSDKSKALETRMSTAEQQITDTAIVSTVKSSHDWSELQQHASAYDWQVRTNALDLNDMKTDGRYLLKGGLTNAYSGCNGWQYLIVESVPNESRVTQTMWHDDTNDNTGYTRKLNSGGSWTPWVREANTANAISVINQSSESIKIQANRIDIDGLVTFNSSNNAIANKIKDAKKAGTDAQTAANNAQSTANDAKSKAENAQSRVGTIETWKSNTVDGHLSHVYNIVNHWAQDASNDTTTINGGLIQTNTITADKIAIGDFTNYCQLSRNTLYGSWYSTTEEFSGRTGLTGFVFDEHHFGRDTCISNQFPCKKGDMFRVTYKLKCDITAKDYNGNNAANVFPQISIYTQKADQSNSNWYIPRSHSVACGTYCEAEVSEVITLTTNTDCYFRVCIQIDASKDFSGWFTIMDPVVQRMTTGELIVDGAITTNKLASKSVNASILADDSVDGRILADNAISNSNFKDENYGTSSSWINLKSGKMNLGGKLTWDGSKLGINGNGSFSGNISASTGNIGGWVIESNGIYQRNAFGNVSVTTGVGGIGAIGTSDVDFLRVQKSDGTYPFYVHKDGSMYAGNATISGNISASTIKGGTINGATITGADMLWYSPSGGLQSYFHYTISYAAQLGDYNQQSTGLVMAGAYGATIDLGMCGNDNNAIAPSSWYSGVHLDGVSTIVRQISNGYNRLALVGGNSDLHSYSVALRADSTVNLNANQSYIHINSDGSITMDANYTNPEVVISAASNMLHLRNDNVAWVQQKDGNVINGGPIVWSRSSNHSISLHWDDHHINFYVDNTYVGYLK